MRAHICIVVWHIEHPIVSKTAAPAVLAYKGSISFQIHIEVFLRVIVIPANYNNIMIWLILTHVTVRISLLIVIRRLCLWACYCTVKRCLHTTIFENSLLYALIVLSIYDKHLLHMLYCCKIIACHSISVRIIRVINRSLPCCQICHSHGILSTVILIDVEWIAHTHMIHGKQKLLLRHKGWLKCTCGRKSPTGAVAALIPD